MTMTKKARLGVAVAAAIGGGSLAYMPNALAIDENAPVGYSATETGQVIIVPYYTVNDNWATTFSITNVSDSALLVKARFHEAQNSRDVLDFNIMMSPKDVWAAYMVRDQDSGNALVKIPNSETTCTTPSFPSKGQPLLSGAYRGEFADGGSTDVDRLYEGYIEFLVIGECQAGETCMTSKDGIGYLTEHEDGEARNCDAARAMSLSTIGTSFPSLGGTFTADQRHGAPRYRGGDYGYGAVRHMAPLKGNVTYLDMTTGRGAGTQALHLDGVIGSAYADDVVAERSANLVTAQSPNYFLEPTIATMPAGLWDGRGLVVLEDRFTWSNVYNEWSTNPNTGAAVDWVVNFPTKGYHVDQFCGTVQANNNAWRYDGTHVWSCDGGDDEEYVSVSTGATADDGLRVDEPMQLAPFNRRWTAAGSAIDASVGVYDREEQGNAAGEPIFSPGVETSFQLNYETNVIRFVDNPADAPLASLISTPIIPQTVLENDSATTGWVDLKFNSDHSSHSFRGLPVYGFAMKTLTQGTVNTNYGQMMSHGYGYDRK